MMVCSRAIPVERGIAFQRTLSMPLPTLFSRWYGPMGPVKAVRDQTGDWGTVGQTRTVVQAGGTTIREELTRIEEPNLFGYTLSGVTGPLAPLVDHIDGEWAFTPAGTGTGVAWRWEVYPKSGSAGLVMPAFALLWQGYARRSLEQLSAELLH